METRTVEIREASIRIALVPALLLVATKLVDAGSTILVLALGDGRLQELEPITAALIARLGLFPGTLVAAVVAVAAVVLLAESTRSGLDRLAVATDADRYLASLGEYVRLAIYGGAAAYFAILGVGNLLVAYDAGVLP